MDIDDIPPAVDFREFLKNSVSACDIFLALVGQKWMTTGNLKDSRDWVRIEIESALEQNKIVLPIVVNDGQIPSPHELPSSMQEFCFRNALPLDTGRDFDPHIRLC